jgi:hypothetical protein
MTPNTPEFGPLVKKCVWHLNKLFQRFKEHKKKKLKLEQITVTKVPVSTLYLSESLVVQESGIC